MPVRPPIVLASPPTSAVDGDGSIFFVGTATTILRYRGFTVLTDPNFIHRGERVHLGYGLTSMRRTEPALTIEELPSLDVVLLSHMHEDHFDRVAAERLDRTLPIVSTPHACVERKPFCRRTTLATWDEIALEREGARLRITALPGKHGPGVLSALLPPVMGSLLEFTAPGEAPFRLYVSGDTLIHRQLAEIPQRFPDIDLALLHLGGTRVLGVLVTMDATQGVDALRLVKPKRAIPIHYDDYTVFKSPLDDFRRAVDDAGLGELVRYVERGETVRFGAEARAARGIRDAAPLAPNP